jgi:hypothetical protein
MFLSQMKDLHNYLLLKFVASNYINVASFTCRKTCFMVYGLIKKTIVIMFMSASPQSAAEATQAAAAYEAINTSRLFKLSAS